MPNSIDDEKFIALAQLTATSVRDLNGEPVGELADLIIDAVENRVAYVRIRLIARDGSNYGQVTIPWSALSLAPGTKPALRLAVRRSTLRRIAERVPES